MLGYREQKYLLSRIIPLFFSVINSLDSPHLVRTAHTMLNSSRKLCILLKGSLIQVADRHAVMASSFVFAKYSKGEIWIHFTSQAKVSWNLVYSLSRTQAGVICCESICCERLSAVMCLRDGGKIWDLFAWKILENLFSWRISYLIVKETPFYPESG